MKKNNVETSAKYLRAKLIDEPFVRTILSYYWRTDDIDFILPTREEDWNHGDIIQISNSNPDNKIYYDVKRNSSTGINTPNFLFAYKSATGIPYEFKSNGYFVYIDDVTADIIILHHDKMKEYVNMYKHIQSNRGDKSAYILIPKSVMRKDAYTIFKGNQQRINFLANNKEYNQFENIL